MNNIFSHHGHYKKGYNNFSKIVRTDQNDQWNVDFGSISRTPMDWKSECIESAKLIRKSTDLDIWIFLSGGIDSEIVLRSFAYANIPVKIGIAQFKNRYNEHDLYFAKKVCDELKLKYYIFEYDVREFWEETFWSEYYQYQMISPMMSICMDMIKKVDGFPVIGMGDGYLERTTGTNDFFDVEFEYESAYEKFMLLNNRPGVHSFFQYTPEQMLSYLESKKVKEFIDTCKKIKLSYFTPWKWLVYNEHFPELLPRIKHHGFEILHGLSSDYSREIESKDLTFNGKIYFPHNEYIKKLKGTLVY